MLQKTVNWVRKNPQAKRCRDNTMVISSFSFSRLLVDTIEENKLYRYEKLLAEKWFSNVKY